MRLALIGLERIGAFHAQTLTGLDAVDSLVVTDAVPAVTAAVAAGGRRDRRVAGEAPRCRRRRGAQGARVQIDYPRSAQRGVTFPAGPPHRFFMDRLAAFRAGPAAFTEVVAGTRPSQCTIDDALAVAYAAEAATLSRREHRPVRIDEITAMPSR